MTNKRELDLIIEYCEHFNYDYGFDEIPIPIPVGGKENREQWLKDEWEREFIDRFELDELTQLLLAANYLNVPALFELCCAAFASLFKGKNFNKVIKEMEIDSGQKCPLYSV